MLVGTLTSANEQEYWREQMETKEQKQQQERRALKEGLPQLPAWRASAIESLEERNARKLKCSQYRQQLDLQIAGLHNTRKQLSDGVMLQELNNLQVGLGVAACNLRQNCVAAESVNYHWRGSTGIQIDTTTRLYMV
jgi:hypothetical protein